MPITPGFLNTCRGLIQALPELAEFRAVLEKARGAEGGVGRVQRNAAWMDAYSDAQPGMSPAYRLRRAVREVVFAQAGIEGTLSERDRERAYQVLVEEAAPDSPRPPSNAMQSSELQRFLLENLLS